MDNARWYDPSLGRFAQADSIVPVSQGTQAWDRYAYVNNNPIRYNDPTGHFIGALVALFIAAPLLVQTAIVATTVVAAGAIAHVVRPGFEERNRATANAAADIGERISQFARPIMEPDPKAFNSLRFPEFNPGPKTPKGFGNLIKGLVEKYGKPVAVTTGTFLIFGWWCLTTGVCKPSEEQGQQTPSPTSTSPPHRHSYCNNFSYADFYNYTNIHAHIYTHIHTNVYTHVISNKSAKLSSS